MFGVVVHLLAGAAAAGGGNVCRVDTIRLDFSAPFDWPLVEVALQDVLDVDVFHILGLEKLSPTYVEVMFHTFLVYLTFVRRWASKTLPILTSAVTVEVSDL